MENNSSSNTAIVSRGGPTANDYLVDFLHFLEQRTRGFDVTYFTTNAHFERTLTTLEYYKIPRNIWKTFLNGGVRIFAQFTQTADFTLEYFLEILIEVVNNLVLCAIDYFFLKEALFVLRFLTDNYQKIIVRALYYFCIWIGQKIWKVVLSKMKKYSTFAINQLGIRINVERGISN